MQGNSAAPVRRLLVPDAGRRTPGPGVFAVAAEKFRLLYFCGFAGRFSAHFVHFPSHRVSNSVVAGRRLAQRAIAWQAVATVLVALGGGVSPAGVAFARLLVGMALKWLLVLIAVVIALAVFRLPGVPLMAGVVAATLALVLANSIKR